MTKGSQNFEHYQFRFHLYWFCCSRTFPLTFCAQNFATAGDEPKGWILNPLALFYLLSHPAHLPQSRSSWESPIWTWHHSALCLISLSRPLILQNAFSSRLWKHWSKSLLFKLDWQGLVSLLSDWFSSLSSNFTSACFLLMNCLLLHLSPGPTEAPFLQLLLNISGDTTGSYLSPNPVCHAVMTASSQAVSKGPWPWEFGQGPSIQARAQHFSSVPWAAAA